MDAIPVFRESQRFRQPWIWLLISIAPIATVYGAVQQIVLGEPFGNHPTSDAVLLVLLVVFGFGIPYLFYLTRLITEVRADGVYLRMAPLQRSFQRIAFEDIVSAQAVTYRAISEYGGYGIRYGKKGKAYNISGNRGVRLEMANGKQLLIGSQRAEELAEAIRNTTARRKPL